MWYFIAIVWMALVAGIFWAQGKKRRKARAAREQQFAALMQEAQGLARRNAGAPPGPAVVEMPPVVTAATAYAKKPALLEKTDALVYLLLRTALPDYEVFAALTLAEVLEPAASASGFERDQALRRLAGQRLDFVVCDKRLQVVAVVLCAPPAAKGSSAHRTIEAALQGACVRCVQLDRTSLPRHARLRALIVDETTPAGG